MARDDDTPTARTSANASAAAPRAPLARGAGTPLAAQLAERFAERIAQRLLPPGARLPSVRECARLHGLNPSTVVAAYDLLQAQGLAEARPQRGFFVRLPAGAATPARAPAGPADLPRSPPVDATALVRSMFQRDPALPAPGLGTLPEEWLDPALLQRAVRHATAGPAAAGAWLRYGSPAGDPGLRHALARRLADIGVPCGPEQIVTTVGATHGLDIVARALLQPGDAVLVDEPGWAVEYERLGRMGMRLLPVPRGADGPDLAVMEALAQAHRPRAYVTVSVLHNPTGQTLDAHAAHRILLLARAHDFTVVEDDTYAFLAPPHATRIAALDGLQRTVLVSGFSKILTPQWRVGFVAAAPALAERLIDTKMLATLTTPALLEQAVAWLLERGLLRRHAERVTAKLDAARARTQRLAQDAGCRFAAPPQGLFGWLDVGMDTERLARRLFDEGWLLAPGSLFHATPRPTTLMRVNFATAQDGKLWRRLRELRGHI